MSGKATAVAGLGTSDSGASPVDTEAVVVLPELWVPVQGQWLSMSAGRVAGDGYSWMQAVHWVAGSGLYQPRRHRTHGPRSLGATTVSIARLLAELSPCRPGIDYLVRRTGLSERAVEYHLAMLRESGLLAWVVRGTRVRGERAQASEFARMVPVEFDQALGIRTVGEGTGRRVTGIAEAGRDLMARLAKKAARKPQRSRKKPASYSPSGTRGKRSGETDVAAVSGEGRCTPMGGGAVGSSTAGTTCLPLEDKLASGQRHSSTPKKSRAKAGTRKLNRMGRRFQLARELKDELDWLNGCPLPRIAWVARNIADAGWTVTDVHGWLHYRGQTDQVRRPSGMLAVLLAGAEQILDTPAKRATAVDQWRAAQDAARRYRIEQVRDQRERFDGDWQAPSDPAVRQQVEQAFARALTPTPQPAEPDRTVPETSCAADPTDEEITLAREEARDRLLVGDTSLITVAVDAMGRDTAERLYGADLVQRALQLAGVSRSSLTTLGSRRAR